jgi:uncharacterized membrane protein YhaH (DUF805 family)
MAWFLYCLRHYRDFDGRASRREYWMNYFVGLALGSMLFILGAAFHPLLILAVLFQIATFVPSLAVTVRRLHDTGLSGRWGSLYVISSLAVWLSILFFSRALTAVISQTMNANETDLATLLNGNLLSQFNGSESLSEIGTVLSVIVSVLVYRKGNPAKNIYGKVPPTQAPT